MKLVAYNNERTILKTGLALVCLPLIFIATSRLLYPYDAGHYEAQIWAPSQLIIAGHNPYSLALAKEPPYTVSTYGPLYYLIIGIGVSQFGLQLWFGRLLSDLGAIIAVISVVKLSLLLTNSRRLAILSTLVFLVQFPVQSWIGMQRADLPALGLSLLGMTVALAVAERKNYGVEATTSFVVLASCLMTGAILCRQTAFLPLFFVSAWYIRRRKWKLLTVFSACSILILGLTIYFVNASSQGGFIQQIWIIPSSLPRQFTVFRNRIFGLFQSPSTWLISGLLGYAIINILRGRASFQAIPNWVRRQNLPGWLAVTIFDRNGVWVGLFALASLSLALVTSSIPGSNINYYLEASAAIALFFPFVWLKLVDQDRRNRSSWPNAFLLLLIGGALFTGARVCRGEYFRWQSVGYFKEVVSQIQNRVELNEPCFSVYPELVASAGRPYYFNSDVPYDGRSPELANVLRRAILSQRLAAIVSHSPESPGGYRRVKLSQPVPEKFYPVYLHVREDLAVTTTAEH